MSSGLLTAECSSRAAKVARASPPSGAADMFQLLSELRYRAELTKSLLAARNTIKKKRVDKKHARGTYE